MTTNEILCSNILRLRKEKGLSQSMLAEKLQITFQSVSKWENNLSCPDISLLPSIAEVLEVSIDELFGIAPVSAEPDSVKTTVQEEDASSFARTIDDTLVAWPDDDKLHAVIFKGHHLLKEQELGNLPSQVELKYEGPAADIISDYSITIEGDIAISDSTITAGSHITCGNITNSKVMSGSHMTCTAITNSPIIAGSHITCTGINDAGSVKAGSHIQVSGDLKCQNIHAGSSITWNANKVNQNSSVQKPFFDFKTDDFATDRLDDLLDELEDLKDDLQDLIDEKNDLADDISDLADELADEFSPELIEELNDKKNELQELLESIEEKKAEIQEKSEQLKNWN